MIRQCGRCKKDFTVPPRFLRPSGADRGKYCSQSCAKRRCGGPVAGPSGYRIIVVPGHPRAKKTKGLTPYVLEHIVIAEAALGKPLPPKAVVHHHNKNRADNRNQNLVICNDTAYHSLLHTRMEAMAATGNPNFRRCNLCKQYDDPLNLTISAGHCHHRACAGKYSKARRDAARMRDGGIPGVAAR